MKKKLELKNVELYQAAVDDAANFGLKAVLENVDGKDVISYETENACCIACPEDKKPVTATIDDVYSVVGNYYNSLMSEINYREKWLKEDINWLSRQVSDLREQLYKHTSVGHLPQITDAGKMQAAVNLLGLGDSVEVVKPKVYIQH